MLKKNVRLRLSAEWVFLINCRSDLYFKDNTIRKDVMLTEAAMSSGQPICFWPLIDQLLGLKVCSTYNIPDSTQMLQSLLNMVKGPFKFSLYVEKSDQTAKKYIFKYNRHRIQVRIYTTINYSFVKYSLRKFHISGKWILNCFWIRDTRFRDKKGYENVNQYRSHGE